MEIATLFGLAGVVANTLWPLIKQRKKLLAGQLIACVLMAIHFALLNAVTGAVIMTMAGIQAALAIPLEEHPRFRQLYLLSALLTPLLCWLTWQGWASLFSSLALILFCLGNLQLDMLRLRRLLLACILAWVAHNLLAGSYPALISNALALATSLYGLWRQNSAERVAETT